jgi:Transglycosylase SLT domain/Sel1 repeat
MPAGWRDSPLIERDVSATARLLAVLIVALAASEAAAQGDVATLTASVPASLSSPVSLTAGSAVAAPNPLVVQALAYEHGEGVPKDQRKASLLYCEAAKAGDPEAMFSLGWMYANGRGVVRSDAMAAVLFERAAAAGHAYARQMQQYVGDPPGPLPDCMRTSDPDDPPIALMDDGPDPFADLPRDKRKIAELVIQMAPQYAIEPRLALAVIATESNFQPNARSVKDARGVMQLVSETATRFKVRNRLDVGDNVRGGLSYLRWLLAYYEGQVTLAVAAYNAGEAAVDRYHGVPPYAETRDYVRRVRSLYPNERHAFDPQVAGPSPMFVAAPKSAPRKRP